MKNQITNRVHIKPLKVTLFLRLVITALNLLALICGIINLIYPSPYLLWNLYGYVILLTLFGNMVSAYFGGVHRYLDYCYLLLHVVSMLLIPIMNTLAASDPQNKTSQSVFVLVLYNVIYLFGAVNAGLRIKHKRASVSEDVTQTRSGKSKNVIRLIAVVVLSLSLPVGIFLSYILLGKSTDNMIEVFIPEYGVFWGLLILGASILIIRLRRGAKGSLFNKGILIAGCLICAICFIPLASVPYMITNADAAYTEAFGDALDEQYEFMRRPFSLQNYLLGTRTSDYILKENVLYYEGTTGADAGIKLHFDAYMPLTEDGGNITTAASVLIRIHGGAWTMGDKGFSNYAGINKHFVNLGYVVFDIQYGLNDQQPSFASAFAPDSVKGDFDIDDMVRHIGIFTSYLADHAGEYGADLNSVFISGASAGGQLAVASALGITGGKYTDILDPRLRVRGIIPFYPANGLSVNMGIGGKPDLVDPVALLDDANPPCLIYHGTHDGIVDPKYACILRDAYEEKSGAPCAVLWMDFASHGSDFYTPGYYNQVFMYYMERFMYRYR